MKPFQLISVLITGFLGSVSWYWALSSLALTAPLWFFWEISTFLTLGMFMLAWLSGAWQESRTLDRNMRRGLDESW